MAELSPDSYRKAVAIQNKKLEEALQQDEPNTEQVLQLVTERDALVSSCLERLTGEELKSFAQQEYERNNAFVEKTQKMFDQSLTSLSKFVKDAKAVRKYR